MKTDIGTLHSETDYQFWKTMESPFSVEQQGLAPDENMPPEILFISSFPPRECGIATYSQDLIHALTNQFGNSFKCSICALESDTEQHIYKQQPKLILNTDSPLSFQKTATAINHDNQIKLVVMQHEFGFFANSQTEYKKLFQQITKPIVFVFHTVLPHPDVALKSKVQEMAAMASGIIVMTSNAATILQEAYHILASKITVIQHGTHLVPPLDRIQLKKRYNLEDRTVLSTFGLLSSSKSIETTLAALPSVVEKHPEVLFLVLGKTHPTILKNEGEKYRSMLHHKVESLHLENNVRFVNEYLQLPILLEYLQLSDIYLFTSKDPNQAVSGTFSYAVSCGCPVISTPIPHAKEVLNNNNGLIVDFENPQQLAVAMLSLLDNEKLRHEISSNSFHGMASTAWQNSAIQHVLLFEKLTANAFTLNYKIPTINLDHIKKMTTRLGMIQFSKISHPDIQSGYTLDDNARALVAVCQHYEIFQNKSDLLLINTYLAFVKHCLQDNGTFLNYVDENGAFTPQNKETNLEDSNGRAIWALGYVCALTEVLPINYTNEAAYLLDHVMLQADKIHSTRAMAFIIKGLHYQGKYEHLELLQTFANRLVQMYKHERSATWHWFENYLTYGNSLLPEAMLCAYLSTGITEYKVIAKESFTFLLSKIFVDNKIKVISNKGWLIKDEIASSSLGGEQPIDVAYTILALEKFYDVFKDDRYKEKMKIAFDWFMGDNHLHQIVYNPCTGGCYDGVEEHNVNLNQGAESTVSYLLARLAVERIHAEKGHLVLAM